jgi:hypothetical protein
VPRSFAELEALLVKTVPTGFIAQPDSVGDTGPSDLAKANSGAVADYRRSVRSDTATAPPNANRLTLPGLLPTHATGISAQTSDHTAAVALAFTGHS